MNIDIIFLIFIPKIEPKGLPNIENISSKEILTYIGSGFLSKFHIDGRFQKLID